MKESVANRLVVVFFAFVLTFSSVAAYGAPLEGEPLPDFDLEAPEKEAAREYLGLQEKGKFNLSQIKADVVIIEIFSMYCPHCQREAPTLNDFYNRIEASQKLRGRVKLIGIGVGNSDFEVDFFRKQYQVPFPLFSDGDFSIHKLLGEVRTPYLIGIKMTPEGSHRVYYAKLGGAKDAGVLLEEMITKAGLD